MNKSIKYNLIGQNNLNLNGSKEIIAPEINSGNINAIRPINEELEERVRKNKFDYDVFNQKFKRAYKRLAPNTQMEIVDKMEEWKENLDLQDRHLIINPTRQNINVLRFVIKDDVDYDHFMNVLNKTRSFRERMSNRLFTRKYRPKSYRSYTGKLYNRFFRRGTKCFGCTRKSNTNAKNTHIASKLTLSKTPENKKSLGQSVTHNLRKSLGSRGKHTTLRNNFLRPPNFQTALSLSQRE